MKKKNEQKKKNRKLINKITKTPKTFRETITLTVHRDSCPAYRVALQSAQN